MTKKALAVEPVPGEPTRFFCQSASRPDVQHIVDVAYQESPADKPRVQCSCEQNFIKGLPCRHIEAVAKHIKEQNA